MRPPWKLIGLAGLAGVAATGVVVVRKRRTHQEYDPDELRYRLHHRLAEASAGDEGGDGGDGPPTHGVAGAGAGGVSRAAATLGRFRAWWSRLKGAQLRRA